jgi:sacsin
VDFVTYNVEKQFPDQFQPWKSFGVTLTKKYDSTLFRFPLRTPEQATISRISKRAYTTDTVMSLFEEFKKEAVSMMLFLKNIESIKLMIWEPNAEEAVDVFHAFIGNSTKEMKEQRMAIQKMVTSKQKWKTIQTKYTLDITTKHGGQTFVSKWLVCNTLNDGSNAR